MLESSDRSEEQDQAIKATVSYCPTRPLESDQVHWLNPFRSGSAISLCALGIDALNSLGILDYGVSVLSFGIRRRKVAYIFACQRFNLPRDHRPFAARKASVSIRIRSGLRTQCRS